MSIPINETVNIGLNAYTITTLLIGAIGGILALLGFVRFFLKKEWRLYKNRARPIMIFKSASQNMGVEYNLLRDSGLFAVEEPSENYQNIDRLNAHSLVIVGYSRNMAGLENILQAIKLKKVPLIIYANYEDISSEDKEKLKAYSYYSICNLPLRLINDVFTILSTYPNKK